MDETEAAIYRKQRSQTEGLGLFAEKVRDIVIGDGSSDPTEFAGTHTYTDPPDAVDLVTSHPDSVAGNSQNGRILKHLQTVGPLTSLDALTLFGCSRLAARIADLKNKGYAIRSRMVDLPNGKRVSEYSMVLDK